MPFSTLVRVFEENSDYRKGALENLADPAMSRRKQTRRAFMMP
jgi:hypothetical protein